MRLSGEKNGDDGPKVSVSVNVASDNGVELSEPEC
jgi:hypothetical protein